MAVKYDPEFYKAIEPMLPAMAQTQKPAVHDVDGRRTLFAALFGTLIGSMPVPPDVDTKIYHTPCKDGFSLPIYHYRKKDATTQAQGSVPAIFHMHGGGLIALNVDLVNNSIAANAALTGVQIFSVDYRLAPEHPFPTPVEDCYTGLRWVYDHAAEFNIDLSRVAVMGESAGGGLAAALAIMARDRELSPPLAKQVLVYPMLDDRSLEPSPIEQVLIWTTEDNVTGWTAYLGDKAGKDGVSPYAAAARVESVKGLPSTYIDVGSLDRFRDEDMQFAARLAAAEIDVEFHLYPGVPHGFEPMARGTSLVERVVANRVRALTSF